MSSQKREGSHLALRVLTVALILGALASLALWQSHIQSFATADRPQSGALQVSVDQATLTLACPPGVIDPTTTEPVEDSELTWAEDGSVLTPLDGGGYSLQVDSETLEDGALTEVAVAGEPQGDLASFLISSCVLPSMESLLPAGSTVTGQDAVLVLSNPAAKAVVAQVEFLSPIGPVLDQAASITVPPLSTVSVLPAVWAPLEDRLAVRVSADGAGVAAWLQSSGLDGEVPLGLSRIPGQQAANTVTLVGFDPESTSTLRIANMGTQPTEIEVSALGTTGRARVGGTEESVIEAHGVFDVDLTGVSVDTLAVQVTSDQPIAAALKQVSPGEPFTEDPSQNVQIRSLVPASQAVQSAALPPRERLQDMAGSLGFSDFEAALVLANPSESSVSVQVGNRTVILDPGFAVSIDLSEPGLDDLLVLNADGPVSGALVASASSSAGQLNSVAPLRDDASNALTQAVQVFPKRGSR